MKDRGDRGQQKYPSNCDMETDNLAVFQTVPL